jgi:hypothetical protein
VQRQVHEKIDLIPSNKGGQLIVAQVNRLAPTAGLGSNHVRNGIGVLDIGIAEDFEFFRIMVRNERQKIEPEHVVPNIRGDIAEA